MAQHKTYDYSHSLIDMMTSIAIIFILVAGYMAQKAGKIITKETITTVVTKDIRQIVSNQLSDLKEAGVVIENDPNDPSLLYIRIKHTLLQFITGRSDFVTGTEAESSELIQKLAKAFVGILGNENLKDNIESIIIEGHTSHKGELVHNIGLSQRRSLAILEMLVSHIRETQGPPRADEMSRHLSSTGLWWNRPLETDPENTTLKLFPDDKRQQRVQIKIKVRPDSMNSSESKAEIAHVPSQIESLSQGNNNGN